MLILQRLKQSKKKKKVVPSQIGSGSESGGEDLTGRRRRQRRRMPAALREAQKSEQCKSWAFVYMPESSTESKGKSCQVPGR